MNNITIPLIELTPRGQLLKELLYEMDRTNKSNLTIVKLAKVLDMNLSDQEFAERALEFTLAYFGYMTEIMNADAGCPTRKVKLKEFEEGEYLNSAKPRSKQH